MHVDEVADGGYNYACAVCHPNHGTTWGHEDGVVNLTAAGMPREADADAAFTPSATPAVKYGVAGTYTTCANIYCHGDFDGGVASPAIGGGNAANAPVWDTPASGDCGTCHGSVAGPDAIAKAWPRTGSYTQSHGEHVVSNSKPGCSSCHDSDLNGAVAAQGTYGDEALHANGAVNLVFGQAGAAEGETVNYEALTATYNDAVGNGAATGAETLRERAVPQRLDDAGVRSGGGRGHRVRRLPRGAGDGRPAAGGQRGGAARGARERGHGVHGLRLLPRGRDVQRLERAGGLGVHGDAAAAARARTGCTRTWR